MMDGLMEALKNPWLTTLVTTQSIMWASIAWGVYRAGRVKGIGIGSRRTADLMMTLVTKQDEMIALQKTQIDGLETQLDLYKQWRALDAAEGKDESCR